MGVIRNKGFLISLFMFLSIILPLFFKSPFIQNLLVIIAINIILVLSLDMILGHMGLISLGHAGFVGIGAYTCVLLVVKCKVPFLIGLLAGTTMAGLVGILIGYPSLRLRGQYFIIITFICGIIFTMLFTNLISITNGPMGIPGVARPKIVLGGFLTLNFASRTSYYYLVLAFIFPVLFLKYRFFNSKMGRALLAIREEEDLGKSVGIRTHLYKVVVFGISTAIAGLAGGLYAHYLRFVGPDAFTYFDSFNLFVMNMVGGSGTIVGPIIGPLLLTIIDQFFQLFKPEVARIFFGLFLILIILYMKKGLMGLGRQLFYQRKDRI